MVRSLNMVRDMQHGLQAGLQHVERTGRGLHSEITKYGKRMNVPAERSSSRLVVVDVVHVSHVDPDVAPAGSDGQCEAVVMLCQATLCYITAPVRDVSAQIVEGGRRDSGDAQEPSDQSSDEDDDVEEPGQLDDQSLSQSCVCVSVFTLSEHHRSSDLGRTTPGWRRKEMRFWRRLLIITGFYLH